MVSFVLGLVCLGGSAPSEITPIEAVAAARWFCRCVDVKPSLDVLSVQKRRDSNGADYGNVYFVQLGMPDKSSMALFVDSTSGDVVHAYTWPFPKSGENVVSSRTDTWLKRLGRSKEVVANPNGQEYIGAVDGHRFLNLNGSSRTMFKIENGHFAWFLSFGNLPPTPQGQPSISKLRAEALTKPARDARMKGSFSPVEVRSELGMFFDDKAKATRWVWKVTPGHTFKGEFSASQSDYIDAQTGAVIADDRIQSSSFMYQARTPRRGLAPVKPLTVDIPLVKLAERRLAEIGRSDIRFQSLEIKSGIRMTGEDGTQLELGPEGELKSFQAPTRGGLPNGGEMVAKAKKIADAQHLKLPEGKFLLDQPRNNYARVIYRQEALGYPYLESEVVAIEFGQGGMVARYGTKPAAPRPTKGPAKYLLAKEIEREALALAQPRLQKDTDKIHYFVQAKVGTLGWYVPRGGSQPVFAYAVDVMFMREVKNWAIQGGGSTYHFDAVTGRCLDKFP